MLPDGPGRAQGPVTIGACLYSETVLAPKRRRTVDQPRKLRTHTCVRREHFAHYRKETGTRLQGGDSAPSNIPPLLHGKRLTHEASRRQKCKVSVSEVLLLQEEIGFLNEQRQKHVPTGSLTD